MLRRRRCSRQLELLRKHLSFRCFTLHPSRMPLVFAAQNDGHVEVVYVFSHMERLKKLHFFLFHLKVCIKHSAVI